MRTMPVLSATLAVALLGLWAAAGELGEPAPSETPAPATATPLLLVKIHADWCLACARLDTTWTKLERRLSAGVELLILDVSDEEAIARARELAVERGVGAFFERYRTQTGTAALLRRGAEEPFQFFIGELDPEVYVAAAASAADQLIAERSRELPSVSAAPPEEPAGASSGR